MLFLCVCFRLHRWLCNTFFSVLQLLFLVTAMIDPRNMPCVRVCIARMSPHELPHNALKQYHNYAAKRKAGDSAPNEIVETRLNGIARHLPVDFSFVSAKNGHEHKCDRSRCTSCTCTTSNTFSVSDFYVPLQDKCQAIFNFLNASNGNVHTTPNVSHLSGNTSILTQENDKSDAINGFCHHDDTSLDSNDSPEASNSRSAIGGFNTQPNKVESGRHSSLSIISRHHSVVSNGKEQTASVPHSPAMSDPVECILKPVLNFGPKNDEEVNNASATDYLEKRTRNHSYGLRNIVVSNFTSSRNGLLRSWPHCVSVSVLILYIIRRLPNTKICSLQQVNCTSMIWNTYEIHIVLRL